MEKTNKKLIDFAVKANKEGLSYGELQAREYASMVHKTKDNPYKPEGNTKKTKIYLSSAKVFS